MTPPYTTGAVQGLRPKKGERDVYAPIYTPSTLIYSFEAKLYILCRYV